MLLVSLAHEANVRIDAIPGPSAITAAFSISGIMGNKFSFLGFAPQKKGRQTFFEAINNREEPVIFYESPHRILKTLEALAVVCGGKKVTIAREITKMHEEIVSDSAQGVLEYFKEHTDHVRGEFVVIVH